MVVYLYHLCVTHSIAAAGCEFPATNKHVYVIVYIAYYITDIIVQLACIAYMEIRWYQEIE